MFSFRDFSSMGLLRLTSLVRCGARRGRPRLCQQPTVASNPTGSASSYPGDVGQVTPPQGSSVLYSVTWGCRPCLGVEWWVNCQGDARKGYHPVLWGQHTRSPLRHFLARSYFLPSEECGDRTSGVGLANDCSWVVSSPDSPWTISDTIKHTGIP